MASSIVVLIVACVVVAASAAPQLVANRQLLGSVNVLQPQLIRQGSFLQPQLVRGNYAQQGYVQPAVRRVAVQYAQPQIEDYSYTPQVTLSKGPQVAYTQAAKVAYTQAPRVTLTQAPQVAYSQAPQVTYSQAPQVAYSQAPQVAYSQAPQVYRQQPLVAGGRTAAILRQAQDVSLDGTYSYGFESDDGITVQVSAGPLTAVGPEEAVQTVSGSYSYTAPDGTPITTNWIADENGFRAEGAHIPKAPESPVRAV